MVKHENFKTCDQSGFCKRNRQYADAASTTGFKSPYELESSSITFQNGQLKGAVIKTVEKSGEKVRLPVTISFLESGSARVTLDEEKRVKGDIELRHNSKARKERYNEAGQWALVGGLTPSAGAALSSAAEKAQPLSNTVQLALSRLSYDTHHSALNSKEMERHKYNSMRAECSIWSTGDQRLKRR